jgi:16S rRNA U1498 N3-methylase RsmE
MRQVYADHLAHAGECVRLGGEEGHYLGRALRARPGEPVRIAAADGSAATAVVEGFSGGDAVLRVLDPDPDPDWGLRLWLDLCPPKGGDLDQALEMAVQLGVERIPVWDEPVSFADVLDAASPSLRLLMSERGGAPLSALALPAADPVRILVGPEGGFTAAELQGAGRAGWRAVSLGPRPLKTSTAVAAAMAGLRALSSGPSRSES